MSASEEPTYEGLKLTNHVDHTDSRPAPIDRALSDLHMNLQDVSSLLNELEAKIFSVLGQGIDLSPSETKEDSTAVSENSRIYNVIREEDAVVVALQDRIRNLTRRVEL